MKQPRQKCEPKTNTLAYSVAGKKSFYNNGLRCQHDNQVIDVTYECISVTYNFIAVTYDWIAVTYDCIAVT